MNAFNPIDRYLQWGFPHISEVGGWINGAHSPLPFLEHTPNNLKRLIRHAQELFVSEDIIHDSGFECLYFLAFALENSELILRDAMRACCSSCPASLSMHYIKHKRHKLAETCCEQMIALSDAARAHLHVVCMAAQVLLLKHQPAKGYALIEELNALACDVHIPVIDIDVDSSEKDKHMPCSTPEFAQNYLHSLPEALLVIRAKCALEMYTQEAACAKPELHLNAYDVGSACSPIFVDTLLQIVTEICLFVLLERKPKVGTINSLFIFTRDSRDTDTLDCRHHAFAIFIFDVCIRFKLYDFALFFLTHHTDALVRSVGEMSFTIAKQEITKAKMNDTVYVKKEIESEVMPFRRNSFALGRFRMIRNKMMMALQRLIAFLWLSKDDFPSKQHLYRIVNRAQSAIRAIANYV